MPVRSLVHLRLTARIDSAVRSFTVTRYTFFTAPRRLSRQCYFRNGTRCPVALPPVLVRNTMNLVLQTDPGVPGVAG